MRAHHAALLTTIIIAVGVAACADDTLVAPTDVPAVTTAGGVDTTRSDTTRTDTTRTDSVGIVPPPRPPVTPPVTPPDSARPVATASHVSGRVFGGVYNPAGTRNDTLSFLPIAGATVKLFHNRLIDGAGVSVFIGEVVTGADGAHRFGPIPGGYYLLRVYPPAGSGFGESLSYLAATQAQVTMNIHVWKRPATVPPVDSTGR